MLLEDLGYQAAATSSSAIALTYGLQDGENISFTDLLTELKRIAGAVSLPVTADVESGYAVNNMQLTENIKALIEVGIVGINIEDSDKKTNALVPLERQCERIQLIKKTAENKGVPLFVNARIDAYVHGGNMTVEEKLQETLRRGAAYMEAGADCIFPIILRDYDHIKIIASQIKIPLNIMAMPGVPEFEKLREAGVRRLSLGSSFLKIAMQSMKKFAQELQRLGGREGILNNEITSDYLEMLVGKNNPSQ